MKNVFILTELKIYEGTSAGSSRMMNVAKALALEGVKVYLCSKFFNININKIREVYPNIFLLGEEKKKKINKLKRRLYLPVNIILTIKYLKKIFNLSKQIPGENVFYIYPQPEISIDVVSLLYGKVINNHKLFYDINELRIAGLKNRIFSRNLVIGLYEIILYFFDFVKYNIAERLTKYYSGLIVISTNIQNYFRRYNRNLLRVPILSDTLANPFDQNPSQKKIEKFLIGFTGQITQKKEGFDTFYKALSIVKSKFEDFELNLYGFIFKNEKQMLLNNIPLKYGIKENIIYHGIIDRGNIMKEIQKNHLLILPRGLNLQTKFGFSTKLSEYLVSGVPVLITDVSDNSLYIKDGYNGFIVQPDDYIDMAKKILYIFSNYKSISDNISKNAYETARKYFDYSNYSKKIYNFLFRI